MKKLLIVIAILLMGTYTNAYDYGLKPECKPVKALARVAQGTMPTKAEIKFNSIGDQGQQGSCAAWSSTFYNLSFVKGKTLSPAWTYNLLNGGRDGGLYIGSCFDLFTKYGACEWAYMPYDQYDYLTQPSQAAVANAANYKINYYSWAMPGDLTQIKRWVSDKKPVTIGIPVDKDFETISAKNQTYNIFNKSYGGHAITICGYDDNKVVRAKSQTLKFQKAVKPTSKIVGSSWSYTIKLGGKTVKAGQTITTSKKDYYIKVVEDDRASKWDDVGIRKGTLKAGINKIMVKVTENQWKYKGKYVYWYFYIYLDPYKVLEKGAVKFANSWSSSWGLNGYGYLSYGLLKSSKFNDYYVGFPGYTYVVN